MSFDPDTNDFRPDLAMDRVQFHRRILGQRKIGVTSHVHWICDEFLRELKNADSSVYNVKFWTKWFEGVRDLTPLGKLQETFDEYLSDMGYELDPELHYERHNILLKNLILSAVTDPR